MELTPIQSKSLFQAVSTCEFCITKTLRLHLLLVLNDADIGAFTSGEEVGDIVDGRIEGKVSEMYGVGRLVGKGKFFTNGVA